MWLPVLTYRTVDSLAVGYGKGKLTCFLGDPDSNIDLVRYIYIYISNFVRKYKYNCVHNI